MYTTNERTAGVAYTLHLSAVHVRFSKLFYCLQLTDVLCMCAKVKSEQAFLGELYATSVEGFLVKLNANLSVNL